MNAIKGLVIIGAGGFGRETLAWARQSTGFESEWTVKGFIDDNLDALAGKSTPAHVLAYGTLSPSTCQAGHAK